MTSPTEQVGPTDTPPSDGVFRDWDNAQHDPQTIAVGEHLGAGTPDEDFVEADGERVAL